jgi:flagellar motility protein MotE (MotC chaperone)
LLDVSTQTGRIYAARMAGLPVFDPTGDQVGRVRDLVTMLRTSGRPPRILGLVVEVFGRRLIFVPMTRVTHISSGSVITTGLVNMRRFEQRHGETRVLGELLDRTVSVSGTDTAGTVYDVGLEQQHNRDWAITRVALREGSHRFGRRGQTHLVKWSEVEGLQHETAQGADHLLETFQEMRPADLAHVMQDLPAKRKGEVAAALDDVRLADVLEELPEEDQVEILRALDSERAADVLEEMEPDDRADLIAELPPETAETLLGLMEPEEAEDVRRLMSYEETTAGGMMTTEPVILPPDATIADALARVRQEELSPAIAAMIYVVRPPLETPTGRLLGVAHIQRLLRDPPSSLVSTALDSAIEPLRAQAPLEEVARHLATYNMVASAVVDDEGRLLGAVTVDDLLDHLLPDNWRDHEEEG